jgi:hypothetical protein
MKYQKSLFSVLSIGFLLGLALSFDALAQQPAKVRKPMKNPPQYPHILDLEGQQSQPAQVEQASAPQTAAQAPPGAVTPADALVQAVQMLAGEVHTLVGEMRALNIRQQAQLELTRLTRLDLRIDYYERELKPVRERIAALEAEEQNLNQAMTREALLAQTASIGTLDRDASMRQLKMQHEYRLRLVQAERERMQQQEAELAKQLNAVRAVSAESEQRAKQTEELLKGNSITPQPEQN